MLCKNRDDGMGNTKPAITDDKIEDTPKLDFRLFLVFLVKRSSERQFCLFAVSEMELLQKAELRFRHAGCDMQRFLFFFITKAGLCNAPSN